MDLAEPVQGKVLSKLPKHPSVAKTGSSKVIQRIAPSGESAKDDIPGAPMEAGKSAVVAHQSQRLGSRGRSRPQFAAGEAMAVIPPSSVDVPGTSNAQTQ